MTRDETSKLLLVGNFAERRVQTCFLEIGTSQFGPNEYKLVKINKKVYAWLRDHKPSTHDILDNIQKKSDAWFGDHKATIHGGALVRGHYLGEIAHRTEDLPLAAIFHEIYILEKDPLTPKHPSDFWLHKDSKNALEWRQEMMKLINNELVTDKQYIQITRGSLTMQTHRMEKDKTFKRNSCGISMTPNTSQSSNQSETVHQQGMDQGDAAISTEGSSAGTQNRQEDTASVEVAKAGKRIAEDSEPIGDEATSKRLRLNIEDTNSEPVDLEMTKYGDVVPEAWIISEEMSW
ncbi:uncharacterized protein PAC_19289 [Phialocephala subalpina]|uniref:Uncharacterized protein n=1 Tax=Phialocephala subalpina TaxID=576137 RepID=A0A1L7XWM9_9HELO|nr:uncharacterized protein PAC_19289 [Phialocephala subalpina]